MTRTWATDPILYVMYMGRSETAPALFITLVI